MRVSYAMLYSGRVGMRTLFVVLLFLGSFLVAQEGVSGNPSQHDSTSPNGEIKLQGCVSRSAGDYVLVKHDPGMTYQLHATGKTNLHHYLGRQVEVVGKESHPLSPSSNALGELGSPSMAFTITSIKTIDKRCSGH